MGASPGNRRGCGVWLDHLFGSLWYDGSWQRWAVSLVRSVTTVSVFDRVDKQKAEVAAGGPCCLRSLAWQGLLGRSPSTSDFVWQQKPLSNASVSREGGKMPPNLLLVALWERTWYFRVLWVWVMGAVEETTRSIIPAALGCTELCLAEERGSMSWSKWESPELCNRSFIIITSACVSVYTFFFFSYWAKFGVVTVVAMVTRSDSCYSVLLGGLPDNDGHFPKGNGLVLKTHQKRNEQVVCKNPFSLAIIKPAL